MSVLPLLLFLAQAAPAPQIHWQRDLEDALAIARDEGRPLFIALNMDGESASERIVREQYRDPAFVADTRRFVCLVASVFRHGPRDHAPDGTRIPCPRLGEVTCGEHIALEPILFEQYLQGERIAPRHALVTLDGTKHFDLSLLFDLNEVGRRLAAAQGLAPAPGAEHPRSHSARLAFERELANADAATISAWLQRAAPTAAPPGLDALRLVWCRADELAAPALERARELALAAGGAEAAAAVVRELLQDVGPDPRDPALGAAQPLLAELERLGAADPVARSFVRSYRDPLPEPRTLLRNAAALPEPVSKPPEPALPEEVALEEELLRLEDELRARPADPELELRRGRAALGLARRRMESGGSGIEFLLTDALEAFARASTARPDDAELLLERARAAFYLGHFDGQEKFARAALETLPAEERAQADVLLAGAEGEALRRAQAGFFRAPFTHEALRWLGDASARLLETRSGLDEPVELAGIRSGMRALSLAVLAPTAEATDWRTLSGFCAALGRRREEIAFALAGLARFPEDDELHSALALALASVGRPDLLVDESRRMAAEHPGSARARWYEGHALVGLADWLRRGEEPDRAIAAYDEAQRAFETSGALEPAFADSVEHYVALAALGGGFAHLLAERQSEAAQALVLGIELRPAIASVRDGLDREALDLLDGVLEARARGASPVDALHLMGELAQADPGNAFWPRAISDSQLREALRATGRGAPEVEAEAFFERACSAGRSAVALGGAEEDRRVLAQAATTLAERRLALGDAAQARPLLAETASLLGELPPAPAAGEPELRELAARLREGLGAARPVQRPGR